ncbi:28S ribosomal protein S7, mitochondrial-like [Mercenaria mercenaria]|uniref:28S ribosomal protein S7, mitochondrial-like n=1 Tax=Mercenaria mercenaria TaxID=6596 RepID=UPI00234E8188|nr:28S ribosomal protein S7, mitochondrial-like [Mercenaria mercenaria]
MAASLRNVTRLFLQDKRPICAICVRNLRYDSKFVESTKTLEALKEPLAEDDSRRFNKIKAALTDDNTFTDFDPVVQKFTNMVMESGHKVVARTIVAKAFENVKRAQLERYHKASEEEKSTIELDPVIVFRQAVENGKPLLITKKVLKGGQSYQVPIAASAARQNFLSLTWLIEVSKEKDRSVRFYDKLGEEIVAAYYNKGGLIKKKQDMHKLCETNKAFAHLAG